MCDVEIITNSSLFDDTQKKFDLFLQVRVYLGDGWRMDFSHTHFDTFSPPDFYTKVSDATSIVPIGWIHLIA